MIPQIEPFINNDELYYLRRVIESTFLVEHNFTKKFEESICNYTKSKYAVSMCNATVALYSCLKALGIENKEHEVIVPNMTFIATANAVIMAGGTPIFCDVEIDNCCINADSIERKINKNTKAIIPVHLYGMSCDIEEIVELGKYYNISIIEDCAQSLGVFRNGVHTGIKGDCGVFSFYGNKILTCGEGGIIITNNDEIKQKCYRLKNHGRDKKGFIHEHIGYNFCITDLQAAVALSQMDKLKRIIEKKKEIYKIYEENFRDITQINMFNIGFEEKSNYWFSSFLFEDKKRLSFYLEKNNIQTRDFFYPLHMQPCYSNMNFINYEFINSMYLYEHGLSLPSSYSLTNEQQYNIIKHIRHYFGYDS